MNVRQIGERKQMVNVLMRNIRWNWVLVTRGAKWMLLPLLLLSFTGTVLAETPSPEKGKAISGQCAACHGNRGKAVDTSYPNLAGQNYQYLVHALNKFKHGQRDNSLMQGIASGLSEDQIKHLAAYYASITAADCKQK
jgi:cytochrome c553